MTQRVFDKYQDRIAAIIEAGIVELSTGTVSIEKTRDIVGRISQASARATFSAVLLDWNKDQDVLVDHSKVCQFQPPYGGGRRLIPEGDL